MKQTFPLLFLCAALIAAETDPVVTVTGGSIRGQILEGGAAFKGIPYARPPVVPLRWKDPQPVEPWTSVRDTVKFSVVCTQLSEGWNLKYVEGSTEDCLYLNVSTPQWPPQGKAPVMVWIHGGSNTAGSGETAGFDKRTMARKGIVLVTINYRLGALGFLIHPELTAESPHHTSGNYGLLDQIAALQWVHDNIAKFGGDAANVTVAGQSAGAVDISVLMMSPLAKGLFVRAIAQSGAVSGFKGTMTKAVGQDRSLRLAKQLLAPEGETIRFLRKLGPEETLKAHRVAVANDRSGLEVAVDGYVLPKPPIDAFAKGEALPVPMMIGNTAQEIGGNNAAARMRETVGKFYGPDPEKAFGLYKLAGEGEGKADPLYGSPGAQWSTDTGFRCPATAQGLAHAAAGRPVISTNLNIPSRGAKQRRTPLS